MTMVNDYGMIRYMETMAISEFKATCLAVLERVRRTSQPILITRRGEPIAEIVPPIHPISGRRVLGTAAKHGRILGDVVSPVGLPADWEALKEMPRRTGMKQGSKR